MGADVIKIEPPEGDEPSAKCRYLNGDSAYFMFLLRPSFRLAPRKNDAKS